LIGNVEPDGRLGAAVRREEADGASQRAPPSRPSRFSLERSAGALKLCVIRTRPLVVLVECGAKISIRPFTPNGPSGAESVKPASCRAAASNLQKAAQSTPKFPDQREAGVVSKSHPPGSCNSFASFFRPTDIEPFHQKARISSVGSAARFPISTPHPAVICLISAIFCIF